MRRVKKLLKVAKREFIYRKIPYSLLSWRFLIPTPSAEIQLHRLAWWRAFGRYPKIIWFILIPYNALRWWGWYAPKFIRQCLRSYGPTLLKLHGISLAEQKKYLCKLAYLDGISPYDYYDLKLYCRECYQARFHFIYTQEVQTFFSAINRFADSNLLADKLALTAELSAQGLPTIPTLAVFPCSDQSFFFPRQDLFLKPVRGCAGAGVEKLQYDAASGKYLAIRAQKTFSVQELFIFCNQMSQQEPYILQPCLQNHPDIIKYAGTTLASLRVFTVFEQQKQAAKVIAMTQKCPQGGSIIDTDYRAIDIEIDLSAEQLKTGATMQPLAPMLKQELDGGRLFYGAKVPCLKQVVAYCERAHQLLPNIITIAWDVAVTPNGPVLIEGNYGLGVRRVQMACNLRLLDTLVAKEAIKRLKITGNKSDPCTVHRSS